MSASTRACEGDACVCVHRRNLLHVVTWRLIAYRIMVFSFTVNMTIYKLLGVCHRATPTKWLYYW